MIGRAGRAGMGSIGESILIINPKDAEKVSFAHLIEIDIISGIITKSNC